VYAVCNGGEEAVRIRWKVDLLNVSSYNGVFEGSACPRCLCLQVEDCADEARVLVRKAIVFLPCPSAGLDVVNRGKVPTPLDIASDLDKLGILDHHGVHNAEKRLVAGEDGGTASQSVPLHEPLALMFRESLYHTPSIRARVLVPLEVPLRVIKDSIKFVAFELIWREQTQRGWVLLENFREILASDLHAALISAFLDREILPFDFVESNVRLVGCL